MSERKRKVQGYKVKKKSVGDGLINILIRPLLHERAGYRVGRPIDLLGPRARLLSPEEVIAIAQGNFSTVHPEKVDDANPQND